ncbi:MAG: tetratricopeptide repeat protein, partial [Gemmatimonadales bacterium]
APRYPHSFELRAISETGMIGAGLLAVGVGAALWAAALAMRRRRGLGAAGAAAGAAVFIYWVAHGTIDWFWEFPALGAPAFAMLGLAAGLLPRAARAPAPPPARPVALRLALLGVVIAAVLSFGGPWLSQLDQNKAVSTWRSDPAAAFRTLDSAASLNPLSATPKLLAGSIALRLGRRADSVRYFQEAIERDPGDAYAHLELGALLADFGRRPEAIATLTEARRLDPRDDLTAGVLSRVRRGRSVDIARVNRQLAARTARLAR